jgi:DNA-binding CsgD family transcriptional regulator
MRRPPYHRSPPRGKSAWEIGRLLNISRRTAAFHLDNAKMKFGVPL